MWHWPPLQYSHFSFLARSAEKFLCDSITYMLYLALPCAGLRAQKREGLRSQKQVCQKWLFSIVAHPGKAPHWKPLFAAGSQHTRAIQTPNLPRPLSEQIICARASTPARALLNSAATLTLNQNWDNLAESQHSVRMASRETEEQIPGHRFYSAQNRIQADLTNYLEFESNAFGWLWKLWGFPLDPIGRQITRGMTNRGVCANSVWPRKRGRPTYIWYLGEEGGLGGVTGGVRQHWNTALHKEVMN